MHEAGHLFLEMWGDLVEAGMASDQMREDYFALLKHLGVESRDELQQVGDRLDVELEAGRITQEEYDACLTMWRWGTEYHGK